MRFQQYPIFGFTSKGNGIARELANQIYVSEVHDPSTQTPSPTKKPYMGIWDTGATNTIITRKVVQELNLQPSGRETVQAVGAGDQIHEFEANTYLINVYLPNNVTIIAIRASEGSVGGGDLLLGMDIISSGDFAITNYNGQTWWTFRVPSNEPIDFVKDIQNYNKTYGPKVVNPEYQKWLSQDRKKKGMRKKKH